MDNTLYSKLKDSIACLPKGKYAIAVSGGSDSLALLYLIAEQNPNCIVVHFDHNVRPESSSEADFVEQTCKKLNLKFIKKVWDNPNGSSGNFYQAARKQRYLFFSQIVSQYKLSGVVVAHSKTDLVETLLMRLSKGASLKGASIFKQGIKIFGVNVYRPLLEFSRQDLQNYLIEQNIKWVCDPSNKNLEKLRPRVRSILPKLEEVGLSLDGFATACKYFNQANDALTHYVNAEFKFFEESILGYSSININLFNNMPLEVRIRLINKFISIYQNNIEHLPRRKNIIDILNQLNSNIKLTISSIKLELINDTLFIMPNNLAIKSEIIESVDQNKYNIFYLQEINKKLRYNLVRKFNLQLVPQDIRNVVPFIYTRTIEEPNVNDISCLIKIK